MSIKGNHFVWLLWQNFKVGNLWNTSRERRPWEAPARKKYRRMCLQRKKILWSTSRERRPCFCLFSVFSSGGHLRFLISKILYTHGSNLIFKMVAVVAILDLHSTRFSFFYIYWSACCSIISLDLSGRVVCEEMSKTDFLNGTILAIFDLEIIRCNSVFKLKWPNGLGEVKSWSSRRRLWQPFWIFNRHDFSYFPSTRQPVATS